MDSTDAQLSAANGQHMNHTCIVCQKTLSTSRLCSVGREWGKRLDQDTFLCSMICESVVRHAAQAFVQGFLVSWLLCSVCDKSAKGSSSESDAQAVVKQESSATHCSGLTHLCDTDRSLPERSLPTCKEVDPVQFDLDDFVTPVHFGTDLFDEPSLTMQPHSSIEAEDWGSMESEENVVQTSSSSSSSSSSAPEKQTAVTSGKDISSNCSTLADLVHQSVSGKLVSLRKSPQTTLNRKMRLQDRKAKVCESNLETQSLQTDTNSDSSIALHSSEKRLSHLSKCRKASSSRCQSRLHVCIYCNKRFINKRLLKLHVKSHLVGKGSLAEESVQNFTCEFCAQTFMNRYSLKAHIKRKHSGEESVECDICGKAQSGTFALIAHKKACHSFYSLCHVCGAEFSGRTSFDKHMASHGGIKRYFCDTCGAGFVHNSSLNSHKTVHLTTKSFQCDVCSQMFKVRHLLNEHLLKTHQCGPSLDHRIRGLKKMGVEVDKEVISRHASGQCIVCGEGLENGRCSSHPDNRQEAFRCPTCGDTTGSIVLFYQHVKWHQGALGLTSHNRRTSLRGDIPVGLHSSSSGSGASVSASLIKCEVCSKTFKSLEYLSAHMHQHREARFVCNVCHKRFTYKCNLKTHMSTHLESWQFECETCQKKFRDKYSFQKHQLKHKEPQFKCDVCGKALTRRPYLLRHYQKMHPEVQPNV